jgi:hypothetical protein
MALARSSDTGRAQLERRAANGRARRRRLQVPAWRRQYLTRASMGTLTLHQNVALDRALKSTASSEIVGPDHFLIAGVQVGDEPASTGERVCHLPQANTSVSRMQKLSRDLFELMVAGLTVANMSS